MHTVCVTWAVFPRQSLAKQLLRLFVGRSLFEILTPWKPQSFRPQHTPKMPLASLGRPRRGKRVLETECYANSALQP